MVKFCKQSSEDNNILKSNIGKILFFIAFSLLIFVDYVSATSIPLPFSGRIFQVTVLLLGIKIMITHYSKTEWLFLILGGVLSVISFAHTNNYFMCILVMLLMASKDISLKSVLSVYTIIVLGISAIVAVLAMTGICGDIFLIQNFRGNGLETRYCMGYTHPNTFHIVAIQLFLAMVWLFWDRIKWYYFIGFFGINLLITYYTDSRTGLLIGSVSAFAYMLLKLVPKLRTWMGIYILGFVALIGSLVLSIAAPIYGHNVPVLRWINQLWTNRIRMAYEVCWNLSITAFSGPESQVNCDMGFVSTTYNWGWVIALLIVVLMCLQLFTMTKHRDCIILVGFVACLIFYLGEKFSSGEFITRNLLFVYMLGWGTYESNEPKKQSA